jgi:hypothetical protein
MNKYPQKYDPSAPENWEDNAWMIAATLKQVEKDFSLQAIPIELKDEGKNYADLVNILAIKLRELEFVHHPRFVAVLYQIDLSQKEITRKIATTKPEALYHVLADAILKRCFVKVYWRKKMSEEN